MKTNIANRLRNNVIPVVLLSGSMIMATVHAAGSISILGEDGQLFSLDTTTGVATAGTKYPDPAGSNETQFSPNGLGISGGNVFYTSFNVGSNIPDTLYRDGSPLTTIPAGEPFNIANGDVAGSNFHFVDRNNGNFSTVGNIFGIAGSQTVSSVPFVVGATMGDLAIDGPTGYLSSGVSLTKFDINTLGVTTTVALNRFVGLGFDGGALYGVLRISNTNFDLYSINTVTLAAGKVADITGIPVSGGSAGGYEITDAARAIPEPGVPLLSLVGGIGWLFFSRKRATISAAR